MDMNLFHRWLCASSWWGRAVERNLLPWALEGVRLGSDTLEIGPGYGANLRLLADRVSRLTAIEISEKLAGRLHREFGATATVLHGDGTSMPLPDNSFDSVVCFTMLHHVPTDSAQDALFAEANRVLRPGGVFAGSDGTRGFVFDLIHLGDSTYTPVDPRTLADRLTTAGFTDITVTTNSTWRRSPKPMGVWQRFRAYKQ